MSGQLTTPAPVGLKRQIGFRTATALIVGEVIGIGIFLTPAGMAKSVGSPLWLLVIWLLMGFIAVCGALSFAELAVRFPREGGHYVYLREAYGRPLAFLYGWMALLVMDPGLTAALAVGMAGYVGYLVSPSPIVAKLVALIAVWVLAAANIWGLSLGAWVLRSLTFAKIALLLFVVFWGFGMGLGSWSNFVPFVAQRPDSAPLVGAIAGGLISAFFSFGGWWDISKVAGEIKEPERTLPRALALGVIIVTLVYVATSAVFFYLIPLSQVSNGETFAAQAGTALFGRFGGDVFSCIVIVAVFGSLAAYIMCAPRVYYAMARDGLLFESVAAVHPRFGTPVRAILLQAFLASVLILLGSFNDIIAYFIFAVIAFLALTVLAVFILRRKLGRPIDFQTPGYPFTPIIFLLLTTVLLVMLGVDKPKQALLGVGVVLLGVPIYYLFFRTNKAKQDLKGEAV
jgi:basic amino acid/polyamine antiporter, APA family